MRCHKIFHDKYRKCLIILIPLIAIILILTGLIIDLTKEKLETSEHNHLIYPSSEALNHLPADGKLSHRKTAKDYFFTASFEFDIERLNLYANYFHKIFIPNDNLNFTTHSKKVKTTAKIFYGNDSIVEMLKLISDYPNEKVGVVIAANATVVGGDYTIKFDKREGKGSQEEGMMAVIDGLFPQNYYYSWTSIQKYRNNENQINYMELDSAKSTIMKNYILYSYNLHLKIRPSYAYKFVNDEDKPECFIDFIADEFINNPKVLHIETGEKYEISAYSIAVYGNKNQTRNPEFYSNLYSKTYNQIKEIINHSLENGIKNIVITVPRSGVLNDYDPEYLKRVEYATMNAIYDRHDGFNNIVICGIYKEEEDLIKKYFN